MLRQLDKRDGFEELRKYLGGFSPITEYIRTITGMFTYFMMSLIKLIL